MVITGYTKNGIKETCRFDNSKGGHCIRHVRHVDANDKNFVNSLKASFPAETIKPDYKITHDGLYASNCLKCGGKGLFDNTLCLDCKGNGWDASGRQFETLNELTDFIQKNGEAVAQLKRFQYSTAVKPVETKKGTKFLPYQIGDLVKTSGSVDNVKNLHTQYGATVMVAFVTENDERVTFFTKNKWVNKIVKGSKITVRGYIKDFKTYDGQPQTILRQATPVEL